MKSNITYCKETQNRIKLLVASYAYEIENKPIMTDAEFDHRCKLIKLNIQTNRPDLDKWFKEYFNPCTGKWIHKYPELSKIKQIFYTVFEKSLL